MNHIAWEAAQLILLLTALVYFVGLCWTMHIELGTPEDD
jgi:hypothetical protein